MSWRCDAWRSSCGVQCAVSRVSFHSWRSSGNTYNCILTKHSRKVYIHKFSEDFEHERFRSITRWVMAPCCIKTDWNEVPDAQTREFTIRFWPNLVGYFISMDPWTRSSNYNQLQAELWPLDFWKRIENQVCNALASKFKVGFWPNWVGYVIPMDPRMRSNMSPIHELWAELCPFYIWK